METASISIPRANSLSHESAEEREVELLVKLESERVSNYLESVIERAIFLQVHLLAIRDGIVHFPEQFLRDYVLVLIFLDLNLEFVPEVVRLAFIGLEPRARAMPVVVDNLVIVALSLGIVVRTAIVASNNAVFAENTRVVAVVLPQEVWIVVCVTTTPTIEQFTSA